MTPDLTAVPPNLWLALGAAMLLPSLLVLPLRGGHGQHAHSGPGALTLAHLTATLDPAAATREPDEDITWPEEHADELDRSALTDTSSRVELELAALLHLFPDERESGHVGRHRLAEPDGFGRPIAALVAA